MRSLLFILLFPLTSSMPTQSEENILQLVSKDHIMQARCRLQCPPTSSQCWQDCSSSLWVKDKGLIESPIDIKLAFKACNIVEWEAPYHAIYQVYSQDSQNAWHNEGQTLETRLKLRSRTKVVKVIVVSSGIWQMGKVHAAVARKPVNCLALEKGNDRSVSPALLLPQKQQEHNEDPEEATASTERKPASYVSTASLALGAVLGAILCVLLGAGVAVLCMMRGRCLSRRSWWCHSIFNRISKSLIQKIKVFTIISISILWNESVLFLHWTPFFKKSGCE